MQQKEEKETEEQIPTEKQIEESIKEAQNELENKKELNWIEKISVKQFIKQAKRKLDNLDSV